MPLLRRKARTRIPDLAPWQWRWVRAESVEPLEPDVNPFSVFVLGDIHHARPVWRAARETVLAEWAEQHPGTRPPLWWLVDAPDLWAAKDLGEPPVQFRFFSAPDSWHDTDAKAQRPYLKKMGIAA